MEIQAYIDPAGRAYGLHGLLLHQVCRASCFARWWRKPGDVAQLGGNVRTYVEHDLVKLTLTSRVVYAFSSLLAFDPWHMLTSFLPYLLLSPTYINILSM